MTSTERVTVPVVLADHPLWLSYSVVESPVLSLLIGRDVVEGLGLDIKGSSKTFEYNGRSQPFEDSVAGHYCVTLSPERYAGLLKLDNSDCVHVPHHLSRGTANQGLHRRWKFLSLSAATTSVDSSSLIAFPQQTCSILVSVLCSRLPVMQLGRIL